MTFSILAQDPESGRMGGAAATGSLCVGGWVLRGSIDAALRASTGREGNPEQVDRSINRLRDAFRREPRLPAVPRNGFIETKAKVGCRLTLAAAEIGFMA